MELRRQSGEHQLVGSMAGIGQEFQENHRRLGAQEASTDDRSRKG